MLALLLRSSVAPPLLVATVVLSVCATVTFVVRSRVVPAAVHLIGDQVWWPSRLASGPPNEQLGSPTHEDTPAAATSTAHSA